MSDKEVAVTGWGQAHSHGQGLLTAARHPLRALQLLKEYLRAL